MSDRRLAPALDLAALLAKVALGDREALRAIYVRHASRLFGLAAAIVRDRVLAADALQEGFVRIWQRARDFDPATGNAETFLSEIVRHACLEATRVRGRERPLDDPSLADTAVDPDALEALQVSAAGQRLRGALMRIDPGHRAALVLAFVHGMSLPQLARRLAISHDEMGTALHRGISVLRQTIP